MSIRLTEVTPGGSLHASCGHNMLRSSTERTQALVFFGLFAWEFGRLWGLAHEGEGSSGRHGDFMVDGTAHFHIPATRAAHPERLPAPPSPSSGSALRYRGGPAAHPSKPCRVPVVFRRTTQP